MVAKARKQEKKTIDPVLPEDSSPEVEIPELKKDMKPFDVRECALISLATGVSVQTLREFREALLTVHPSSVYHHFWGRLLQPHFDEPEYNNDFAGWAIHGLDDRSLAERLAVIDPTDYGDIEQLRAEVIDIVEQRLDESELLAWTRADQPFHFIRAQIVVLDSGVRINEPAQDGSGHPRDVLRQHLLSLYRRPDPDRGQDRRLLGLAGRVRIRIRGPDQGPGDAGSLFFILEGTAPQTGRHLRGLFPGEGAVSDLLDQYAQVVGESIIGQLRHLAAPLKGLKVVHVNSTREGGGVAEILHKLIPLKQALGLDVSWEVIEGNKDFFKVTKSFHNGLQGNTVALTDKLLAAYEKVNEQNAEELRPKLEEADVVIIHDPQPAALLRLCPNRRGKWIWRCHIDASRPYRPVWRYLREWVKDYNASIFSLAEFARRLPHPMYLIPPSIDPLSEKNMDLPAKEVHSVFSKFDLDPARPIILQVSRFDRFKDPLGVIEAYRLAKKFVPLQLVLAGGGASDDPEGQIVLDEVNAAVEGGRRGHPRSAPALGCPQDHQRPAEGLGHRAPEIHQGGLRPDRDRGHVEGPSGHRRRHRGDQAPGDQPLHRVPGAHPGGGGAADQVSASPQGEAGDHGPPGQEAGPGELPSDPPSQGVPGPDDQPAQRRGGTD